MNERYILSVDQGTTSSRAIIFNKKGEIIGQVGKKHKQIFEKPEWVAHNPIEIYENVVYCCREVVRKMHIMPNQIAAIGITNQRETIVAWDKKTRLPLCDAIVWQCRRTAEICQKIKDDGLENMFRSKTGLINDPYFSGTKIKWLIENNENVRKALNEERLLVGTIDSFLLFQLTKGEVHGTDYSNASRTMLFNINKLEWDSEILEYFQIPEKILPRVLPSSGFFGNMNKDVLGQPIPITGIAGDQHAALFGQTCFEKGAVKNTYGSGCFLLINTGEKPVISENGLLATIAWHLDGKTTYALEGGVFNAGTSIEWLINNAKMVSNVKEIEEICLSTLDTNGVYFIPAFLGLGAPHWDMHARAAIFGMNLSTNNCHIVRAVAESIAYSVKDVLDYIETETGLTIKRLNVDGGVSKSNFLMQFQSDLLEIDVVRPKVIETTALGAAYLAGLFIGYWKDIEEIKKNVDVERVFVPNLNDGTRDEKYKYWLKAIEKATRWTQ